MKYLQPEIVDHVVGASNGKLMTVTFVKSDGAVRSMNCRVGVRKHLRGGEKTTSHIPDLVTVFDNTKHDYRCFNKGRVVKIAAGGMVITTK